MYRFFVVLLLGDALVLAAAVLLQAGKGGGLAASFGGAGSSPNSLLGSREAGNMLTKASWWAGGIFIGLAYCLQIMAGRGRSEVRSVLDPVARQSAPAPTNLPASGATQAAPLQPIAPPATGGSKAAPAKQPPDKQTPPAKPPAGKQF